MARKVRGDLNIEYLAGDGGMATTLNKAVLLINFLSGSGYEANQWCRSLLGTAIKRIGTKGVISTFTFKYQRVASASCEWSRFSVSRYFIWRFRLN